MTNNVDSRDADLALPLTMTDVEREELNKLFPPVRKEDVSSGGINFETAEERFNKAVENLEKGDGLHVRPSSYGGKLSLEVYYRHSF